MNAEIKPLDTQFTLKGVEYTQLARNGEVAVYRRQKLPKGWVDFEVVRIRSQKSGTVERDGAEVKREAKELYPNDNQWGDRGWTFQTEESGMRKYRLVLEWLALPIQKRKKVPLASFEGQHSGSGSGGLES
jgi:hypothetical protein